MKDVIKDCANVEVGHYSKVGSMSLDDPLSIVAPKHLKVGQVPLS